MSERKQNILIFISVLALISLVYSACVIFQKTQQHVIFASVCATAVIISIIGIVTLKILSLHEIKVISQSVREVGSEDKNISKKMEYALKNNEFKLYLQPKYNIKTSRIIGAEALVRWQEKNGNIISPCDFIPLFELNGFIEKLDFYMLESACKQIRKWLDEGEKCIPISVNFSRIHMENEKIVEQIKKVVSGYGIPRKFIEIELTESTMINNERRMVNILNSLHESGFVLSMDDFGSGYSSLGLLKNLNVDIIKMDKSFLTNNTNEEKGNIVIESVIDLAKKLNIKTVAEGVETIEQVAFLECVNCEIAQGYYYSKPVPAELFCITH